jgi:hypothetical protein
MNSDEYPLSAYELLRGTITFAWAIWVLYVCAVGGAVLAVVIRYTVVLPPHKEARK